jgi:hypothetical protein
MFRTAQFRFSLSIVALYAITGEVSLAVAGQDELPAVAAHAAENMARFLKARNKETTSVIVHPIPTLKSTVANAVTQHFAEALKSRNIRLADNVEFALDVQPKLGSGVTKSRNPTDDSQIEALRFEVSIINRLGEKMVEIDFGDKVADGPELRGLLGLSGNRSRQTTPSPEGPNRSIVRASPNGPYGIEIVVKGRSQPGRIEDGFAYVNLSLDEEYSVRIHNDSGFEAAVALRIDGLSVFHFSEVRKTEGPQKGEPQYQWYILPPGTTMMDIQGWHVSNERSKAFKVGLREDSLAAKAGLTTDIGVIHAQFFASWESNAELTRIPPDEPARKDRGKTSPTPPKFVSRNVLLQKECRDGISTQFLHRVMVANSGTVQIGTTFGSDIITGAQGVSRVIGFPRDSIGVRYRMPQ